MKRERPVILVVERIEGKGTARDCYPGADLEITHMRRMNALEYAWHCFKQLLTRKHKHKAVDVNTDTMHKVGFLGYENFGIEMSMELWYELVHGHKAELDAWGWLRKHNIALLSPVPPSSVPVVDECGEVVEV